MSSWPRSETRFWWFASAWRQTRICSIIFSGMGNVFVVLDTHLDFWVHFQPICAWQYLEVPWGVVLFWCLSNNHGKPLLCRQSGKLAGLYSQAESACKKVDLLSSPAIPIQTHLEIEWRRTVRWAHMWTNGRGYGGTAIIPFWSRCSASTKRKILFKATMDVRSIVSLPPGDSAKPCFDGNIVEGGFWLGRSTLFWVSGFMEVSCRWPPWVMLSSFPLRDFCWSPTRGDVPLL